MLWPMKSAGSDSFVALTSLGPPRVVDATGLPAADDDAEMPWALGYVNLSEGLGVIPDIDSLARTAWTSEVIPQAMPSDGSGQRFPAIAGGSAKPGDLRRARTPPSCSPVAPISQKTGRQLRDSWSTRRCRTGCWSLLTTRWPDYGAIGEEMTHTEQVSECRNSPGRILGPGPLDGTTNFTSGFPMLRRFGGPGDRRAFAACGGLRPGPEGVFFRGTRPREPG